MRLNNPIKISGSPHIHCHRSTSFVMWNVCAALLPALGCAVWFFGAVALLPVIFSILGAIVSEYVGNRWLLDKRCTLTDGSAFLTGLLLGMSLPSSIAPWMAFVGGFFAILVGKTVFGGLGQNIFNPAMVGRVFLLISFPVAMTTWPVPLAHDGTTGATFLTAIAESGFDGRGVDLVDMAIGNRGGSLGEIGAIALIIGGLYLCAIRIIKPHIPVIIIATLAIMAFALGYNPVLEILSGGVLLGAIFMATDYVTSPMEIKGQLIYGVMIGIITFVIRHYGSYPEGISFAILLMNGFTPLINRYMKPRVFGERSAA